MRNSITTAVCLLPLLACTTESTSAPTTENETATETETGAAAGAASGPMASAERAVICGCQIETVHRCSEWVDVDGEWVALELPTDMGSMPFCGKEGLRANVEGEIVEGTYVASSFALVD
ncbi:MAG: hypothetical protein ACYSWX_11205 [Planctomycetota bacterium]|jgi:hypothetical protein